jgi:hypothetical protein
MLTRNRKNEENLHNVAKKSHVCGPCFKLCIGPYFILKEQNLQTSQIGFFLRFFAQAFFCQRLGSILNFQFLQKKTKIFLILPGQILL